MRLPGSIFFWRPPALADRDDWLTWLEWSGYRERTISGYRNVTDRFFARWPGNTLSQISEEMIQGFIEEVKPCSRQQRRGCMQNLFGWAYRNKRIKRDVMRFVPTYKQVKQEPVEVFTFAEIRVLEAIPYPDDVLMAVLFGTGIRKSEARMLTAKRINFETAELHIVEGAKGGSAGIVPLESALLTKLDEYLMFEGLGDDEHLWYCHPGGSKQRRHSKPIGDGAMQNWWVRCLQAGGIPYKNLHCTRHTYVTMWRRRGLTLDDVSFLARHADFKTTRKVYDHTRVIDVRRRMDQCLSLEEVSA